MSNFVFSRVEHVNNLSHTFTSIAHDTRLLAEPYQPIQVELSSPAIQNSCRGLIRRLIRWLIFSCTALPRSWYRPVEQKQGTSAKQCKNKESGFIIAHFTWFQPKSHWKHRYPFLTSRISIQNGVSVKLSNVMTSQQCQRGAQRFREQKDWAKWSVNASLGVEANKVT